MTETLVMPINLHPPMVQIGKPLWESYHLSLFHSSWCGAKPILQHLHLTHMDWLWDI